MRSWISTSPGSPSRLGESVDLGKETVRGWVMVTDWVRAMEMVNGRG